MGAKKQVLVVEDDSVSGMEIRDALEEQGYAVVDVISSGEKAVKVAKEARPALLLMDIKIKGIMTGLEVAKEIRLFSESPIIFITGYRDSHTEKQIATIKNSFLIAKPFDFTQLNNLIEQVLGGGS